MTVQKVIQLAGDFEVEAFQDNDLTFSLSVVNVNDPSAWTVQLSMKEKITDSSQVTGFPITGSWDSGTSAFLFTVADTLTAGLKEEVKYVAEIARTDADNETTLATGTIKWKAVVRSTPG